MNQSNVAYRIEQATWKAYTTDFNSNVDYMPKIQMLETFIYANDFRLENIVHTTDQARTFGKLLYTMIKMKLML